MNTYGYKTCTEDALFIEWPGEQWAIFCDGNIGIHHNNPYFADERPEPCSRETAIKILDSTIRCAKDGFDKQTIDQLHKLRDIVLNSRY